MASSDETRILLVNDDPGSRFALHAILADLNTPIDTAASGEEALALHTHHISDFASRH